MRSDEFQNGTEDPNAWMFNNHRHRGETQPYTSIDFSLAHYGHVLSWKPLKKTSSRPPRDFTEQDEGVATPAAASTRLVKKRYSGIGPNVDFTTPGFKK